MTKSPWNKNKSVGQKIKLRREQLNLDPIKLAKKIGIARQEINRLEKHSSRPSAEMLLRVSSALDTTMAYFLTDCEINDVDEEVLLVKFRKLSKKGKELAIRIINII